MPPRCWTGIWSGKTWSEPSVASFRYPPTLSSSCSGVIAPARTRRRSTRGWRLFNAKALETGEVKIIDLVTARVDNKGEYVASLPSLRLTDVRISSELVNQHERMLTGGFYAELGVTFDVAIAQEAKGRPFGITSLREIQLSKRDVLDTLTKAREAFTTEEWKCFLLRSIGIESGGLSDRQRNALLLRMVPFVERNYNLVELGPRGTGKSHLFQQF